MRFFLEVLIKERLLKTAGSTFPYKLQPCNFDRLIAVSYRRPLTLLSRPRTKIFFLCIWKGLAYRFHNNDRVRHEQFSWRLRTTRKSNSNYAPRFYFLTTRRVGRAWWALQWPTFSRTSWGLCLRPPFRKAQTQLHWVLSERKTITFSLLAIRIILSPSLSRSLGFVDHN